MPFKHPDDLYPEYDTIPDAITDWLRENPQNRVFSYPSNGKPAVKRFDFKNPEEEKFAESSGYLVAS